LELECLEVNEAELRRNLVERCEVGVACAAFTNAQRICSRDGKSPYNTRTESYGKAIVILDDRVAIKHTWPASDPSGPTD
jgi:hypothetical protein